MIEQIKKNILVIAGALAGGLAGYLYYHYVGCDAGTCAITSKPLNSTLYGSVLGGLFLSLFIKEKNTKQ